MAVQKINGFKAPYRSLTFRNQADAVAQRNGVLYMAGQVSVVNGSAVVPPFMAMQQGLLISKTDQFSMPMPSTLPAPFWLTVSAATSSQVDDLTFRYAKSPVDLNATVVVLASYDGNEWHATQKISADGLILDAQIQRVDLQETGPKNGLLTSLQGSALINTSGYLIDSTGEGVGFALPQSFPVVPTDVDWPRVDRMVYRRPADTTSRIGVRKLIVGGTYSASGPNHVKDLELADNSAVHDSQTVLVDPTDNAAHVLYTEGYGNDLAIRYQKYYTDRQTKLIGPLTIGLATSSKFSAAQDRVGNIHVVFQSGMQIQWIKISNTGDVLAGPVIIDGLSSLCSNPSVQLGQYCYIVYQTTAPSLNQQLQFASVDLNGHAVTAPKPISNTLTSLVDPSCVLTPDSLVYCAYTDQTNGKIYVMVLDTIGTIEVLPHTISGATLSQSFGTLIDRATNPIMLVSDSQVVKVAFRQRKDLNSYGVAVWDQGSGLAYMADLTGSTENITSFRALVDPVLNEVDLIVAQASRVDYAKLEGHAVRITDQLAGSACSVALARELYGSITHCYSLALPGTYTNAGPAETIDQIGPAAVAGSVGPLVLASNQMAGLVSHFSYVPKPGDQVTMAGSAAGNNGIKRVTLVQTVSHNTTGDTYVITCDTSFVSPEVPCVAVTGQFAIPDGSALHLVKSVAQAGSTQALRSDVPGSDILLARICSPGSLVLNYIPQSGPGVNSDIFGMYGSVAVDWSSTQVGALTMAAGASIIDLITNQSFQIGGGTFPMTDGQALYVVLDGSSPTVIPQVTSIASLPWGLPIQVLGFVKGTEFAPHLFSVAGMGELEAGESVVLGQDLPTVLRQRLGITGDLTYQPYNSTVNILASDNYPTAIGKLDSTLAGMLSDVAQEEEFVADNSGPTSFTTSFTFSPDHTLRDIVVTKDGRKVSPDTTGGLGADWRKVGNNQIQFAYPIDENVKISIRNERTGGTSTVVDWTNVNGSPQPVTNGSGMLGSISKGWGKLFLKDTMSNQVYELKIVSGIIQVVAVP